MYKVLVVEDETPIRKGIIFTFDWRKYNCFVTGEATNGLEGVQKIIELKPDIIVTDIGMPIMSGLDMLEEVAGSYDFSSIVITVYDEFEKAKTAINVGVTEYLLKPLDHAQLALALEKAKKDLESKRAYTKEIKALHKNDDSNIEFTFLETEPKNFYTIKIMAFIEKNYNRRIGLKDIEKELNISSTYINRVLKEDINHTFTEVLNKYRIKKAIKLMQAGEKKIYRIAEEVGYRDYKYFLTVFKKYVKTSPGKILTNLNSNNKS